MESIIKYVECNWGVDRNTSATILITLLVFVTGILVNELISWIRFQIKLFNTSTLINQQVKSIAKDATLQAKSFSEFNSLLTVDDNKPLLLAQNTITHLDTIDKIDLQELYNSIFRRFPGIFRLKTKRRIKAFSALLKHVSNLKTCESRYPADLEKLVEKFGGYQQTWNQNLETLRRLFDDVILNTHGQQVPAAMANYIVALDAVWHTWQQLPSRLFYNIVHNSLLLPLQQLNAQHPTNRLAHAFNNPILNAMHAYDNMNGLFAAYKVAFKGYENLTISPISDPPFRQSFDPPISELI